MLCRVSIVPLDFDDSGYFGYIWVTLINLFLPLLLQAFKALYGAYRSSFSKERSNQCASEVFGGL